MRQGLMKLKLPQKTLPTGIAFDFEVTKNWNMIKNCVLGCSAESWLVL